MRHYAIVALFLLFSCHAFAVGESISGVTGSSFEEAKSQNMAFKRLWDLSENSDPRIQEAALRGLVPYLSTVRDKPLFEKIIAFAKSEDAVNRELAIDALVEVFLHDLPAMRTFIDVVLGAKYPWHLKSLGRIIDVLLDAPQAQAEPALLRVAQALEKRIRFRPKHGTNGNDLALWAKSMTLLARISDCVPNAKRNSLMRRVEEIVEHYSNMGHEYKIFEAGQSLLASLRQLRASLSYPLALELKVGKKDKMVHASIWNKRLKKKGSKLLIPDFVELTSTKQAEKTINFWEKEIAKAAKILGEDAELYRFGSLSMYTDGLDHPLSYSGDPKEAVALIASLTDNAVSDQMQVVAWRYKDKSWITDADSTESSAEFLEEIPEWKNWTGKGEDLLVITVDDDDGTNFTPAVLKRCGDVL